MEINLIFILLKNFIMNKPEILIEIIIFLSGLPKFIEGINSIKEKNIIEKVKKIIEIESEKILNSDNLDNEQKKERVLEAVYHVIPIKYHKFLPKDKVYELINMVYHTYIKQKRGKITNE